MSKRLFFLLKLFRISLVVRRSEIGISGFSLSPVSDYLNNWEFLGLVWLTRVPIKIFLSCGFPNLFLSCMYGDEWLDLLLNSLRHDPLSTR